MEEDPEGGSSCREHRTREGDGTGVARGYALVEKLNLEASLRFGDGQNWRSESQQATQAAAVAF